MAQAPQTATVIVRTLMPRGGFSRWLLSQGVSRPEKGDCPCCGVQETSWCHDGCLLIDKADSR